MANDWIRYKDDFNLADMPTCGGAFGPGYTQASWCSKTSEMVVTRGQSHDPNAGGNSVRFFKPTTDKWRCLWPNGPGNGGLRNSDRGGMIYIPELGSEGKLWMIGGVVQTSPDLGPGQNHYAGLFDVGVARPDEITGAWQLFVENPNGDAQSAHAAVAAGFIRNHFGFSNQCAFAYDPIRRLGVMWGGDQGRRLTFFRPNTQAGPQIYEQHNRDFPPLVHTPAPAGCPPGYFWVSNHGVVAGDYFYMFGGASEIPGSSYYINYVDLWRLPLDGLMQTTPVVVWTKIATPPAVTPERQIWGISEQSFVTYDASANAIVIHGGHYWDRLVVYSITDDSWVNNTVTMDRTGVSGLTLHRNGGVCAYAPTVNRHIYTGGNWYSGDNPSNQSILDWPSGGDIEISSGQISMTGYQLGTFVLPPGLGGTLTGSLV